MTDSSDGATTVRRRKITRRRALAWGGGVVGTGLASALGYGVHEGRSRGYILRTPDGPPVPLTDHRVALPGNVPPMVIARGKDAAKNVDAALSRMGGMGQFVGDGDVVIVKPNIGFTLSHHYAVTTNPDIVRAVVTACVRAGAKEVIVTDGPVKHVDSAFDKTGIRRAAVDAGATVVTPNDTHYVNTTLPGWGTWQILEPYARATKVIAVPATKHHSLAGTTIGMKGWFGSIGGLRFKLHPRIDEAVAGLAEMMRPTLTVVDAMRVLMRNGPSGGNLDDAHDEGAVAVSVDPVAADAWGSTLVRKRPGSLGWLKIGEERGLGRVDFKALSPVELTI